MLKIGLSILHTDICNEILRQPNLVNKFQLQGVAFRPNDSVEM
jgi:hypothetical protein